MLGSTDHRADCDRQDVEQLVPAGALNARIAHAFEVFKQAGLDSGAHGRTEEVRAGRQTMPASASAGHVWRFHRVGRCVCPGPEAEANYHRQFAGQAATV